MFAGVRKTDVYCAAYLIDRTCSGTSPGNTAGDTLSRRYSMDFLHWAKMPWPALRFFSSTM